VYEETVFSRQQSQILTYIKFTSVSAPHLSASLSVPHIASLEGQCHNSKIAHFELCPQELCLRPYLPSEMASHVYFLKWPPEGRSFVILLMRLHRPGQWFFLSPEKFYFSSCDSVLLEVR
jgi:hypothetical protein